MHLPAYQRQVLRMYHTDGKSYEEIAEETGLSIGTVKSRLNRARNMLRERLAPYQECLMVA
jgi:RNA polymerase sigma-70 factor (ECF subfamily)